MTQSAPYIFISHSSRDKEFAHWLDSVLRKANFQTWFDVDSIPQGSTWAREIEHGVEGCGALVVVMSDNARESEWVERETLLAMSLRKPVFIALIDETRLPIYLINRQHTDFRTRREAAAKRLVTAMKKISLAEPLPEPTKRVEAAKLAPEPNETNFFKYLKQLPDGDKAAEVAQNLYRWGKTAADSIVFSGWSTPVFHVRVALPIGDVTIFSVWAYSREPAVEVAFRYLQSVSPYDERQLRLSTLDALNRLMPDGEKFPDDRADRRPNLALVKVLGEPGKLADFQQIIQEIVDNLRASR
jgi:TIR domain-containing protein